ncbi:hypothetical protein M0812_29580 [Anaeramoeba flamelloides]|uniref:Sec23/Sec24 trunk domain-containing protein n=1 Tax=Anaeramoeba flamelloides TaxID=1746091 RepID=A0AAV7Y5L8_9EUKA|nr:hypothetical protein M0812_29580 [Anaeramoeba flamelloides]
MDFSAKYLFDNNNTKHGPKQGCKEKVMSVVNTLNCFSLDLGQLNKKKQELKISDLCSCKNCGANFNKFSKMQSLKDFDEQEKNQILDQNPKKQILSSEKIWKCEFCGHHNDCTVPTEKLPTKKTIDYLMPKEEIEEESVADQSLLIYCIDLSGSMSQNVDENLIKRVNSTIYKDLSPINQGNSPIRSPSRSQTTLSPSHTNTYVPSSPPRYTPTLGGTYVPSSPPPYLPTLGSTYVPSFPTLYSPSLGGTYVPSSPHNIRFSDEPFSSSNFGSFLPQTYPNNFTNSNRSLTRFDCVKIAIMSQLSEVVQNEPNTRVIIVTFSGSVQILYPSFIATVPIKNTKEENLEYFYSIGKNQPKPEPICKSKNKYFEILQNCEVSGPTCLGPAIAISAGIAARQNSSRIILCTDGQANLGIGQLDTKDNTTLEQSDNFYHQLADQCAQDGSMIDIIKIIGSECELNSLGKLTEKTGGDVLILKPKDLAKRFKTVLKRQVIAKNVSLRIIANTAIFVSKQGKKLKSNILDLKVGNVKENSQISFNIINMGDDLGENENENEKENENENENEKEKEKVKEKVKEKEKEKRQEKQNTNKNNNNQKVIEKEKEKDKENIIVEEKDTLIKKEEKELENKKENGYEEEKELQNEKGKKEKKKNTNLCFCEKFLEVLHTKRKTLPIQAQINFVKPNGFQCRRIITKNITFTNSFNDIFKEINYELWNQSIVQKVGRVVENDEIQKAFNLIDQHVRNFNYLGSIGYRENMKFVSGKHTFLTLKNDLDQIFKELEFVNQNENENENEKKGVLSKKLKLHINRKRNYQETEKNETNKKKEKKKKIIRKLLKKKNDNIAKIIIRAKNYNSFDSYILSPQQCSSEFLNFF